MAFRKAPPKDPDETLDYGWDWAEDYLPKGDAVSASTWEVPDGIDKQSESFTDSTTTVWLAGGSLGETYDVTNRVTTKHGRQAERSFTIKISNK